MLHGPYFRKKKVLQHNEIYYSKLMVSKYLQPEKSNYKIIDSKFKEVSWLLTVFDDYSIQEREKGREGRKESTILDLF